MRRFLIFLLLLPLLFSCKKDVDSVAPVPSPSDQIKGKWRLNNVKLQYFNDAGALIEESYATQVVYLNFTAQHWTLSSYPNGPIFQTRSYSIENQAAKDYIRTTNNSGDNVKYEITTLNKTRMQWVFVRKYKQGEAAYGRGQIPLSKYVEIHFFERD